MLLLQIQGSVLFTLDNMLGNASLRLAWVTNSVATKQLKFKQFLTKHFSGLCGAVVASLECLVTLAK